MTDMTTSNAHLGPRLFREVLSHYPTGVVLVTGREHDEHLGMIVGSFTSVSLEPPLVAFMADHGSRTYARMKACRNYVVNILGSDQEDVCRRFSSKIASDKWAHTEYEETDTGIRRLSRAVAHVECERESTITAGDHDIVISRVTRLQVNRPTLPLLFFQGGYGKFAPRSLVVPSQELVLGTLQMVDMARPALEDLSRDLNVECSVQARVGNQLITLASSRQDANLAPTKIGRLVPHIPPLGSAIMAWETPDEVTKWLADPTYGFTSTEREAILDGLEKVRRRGYSISLRADEFSALESLAERFTRGAATPSDEKQMRSLLQALIRAYEPDNPVRPASQIRLISAAVVHDSRPVFALQVWYPKPENSNELDLMVRRIRQTVRRIEGCLRSQAVEASPLISEGTQS